MEPNGHTEKLFANDDPTLSFRQRVHRFEMELISRALKAISSQVKAAKALKMDRTVLRRRLSKGKISFL